MKQKKNKKRCEMVFNVEGASRKSK